MIKAHREAGRSRAAVLVEVVDVVPVELELAIIEVPDRSVDELAIGIGPQYCLRPSVTTAAFFEYKKIVAVFYLGVLLHKAQTRSVSIITQLLLININQKLWRIDNGGFRGRKAVTLRSVPYYQYLL